MTSWGQFTVSLLMRALNRQQHRQGKPLNYYHCLSLACFLLPLMGYLWSLLLQISVHVYGTFSLSFSWVLLKFEFRLKEPHYTYTF